MKKIHLSYLSNFLFYTIMCFFCTNYENVYSQQVNLINTYAVDPLLLNPAFAGKNKLEANIHYRTQWLKIDNAPKQFQFNSSIGFKNNTNFGLKINQQKAGLLSNTNITGIYAYNIKFASTENLRLGLGLSFQQNMFNISKAIFIDPNDIVLQTNNSNVKSKNFDSEFGILYKIDMLTLGFGVFHLFNTNNDIGNAKYKQRQEFSLLASYTLVDEFDYDIETYLLGRHTFKGSYSGDLLALITFKKSIGIGLGYRTNYGIISLLSINYNDIRIAYSYDYITSKIHRSLGSSHQIMIGYQYLNALTNKSKNAKQFSKRKYF